ncbi:tyrosine-type recombinase/integrase [Bradyrhizobium erythrophlei]|uniref:Integrase/recombinase XerD n=1 Tax=Bradyrhizobium erythrophlei TaxID=1437360 RepID=A0A1M5YP13_9BRAD|nr:site-specific integrase [Bradyrhizobium erythrophlei]SHI13641.1 integrase/recombinase XerD [Bradyrhizobium erythrophlei]
MALGKQAKTLSKGQVEAALGYLAKTRRPARNRLIFLLSAKAGLRAKEIARLTWWMTNDSQGEIAPAICLQDSASKGKSGRVIPLSDEVRNALIEYRRTVPHAGPFVISTERSLQTSPQAIVNMFQRWYRHVGFVGCSSHSGRRTFITNAARKISTVGGSLRDVQVLAGHTNLRTTQRYIEPNAEAQVRIVELV